MTHCDIINYDISHAGLIGNGLVIAVLGGGGMLVSSGSITVGQLSSFMLYVVFTGTSVNGLSTFYAELMKGSASLIGAIQTCPPIRCWFIYSVCLVTAYCLFVM
ncbi:ABCB10 [Bugula neritina]|uniref:ABCB10 n=1 Tax=Bugula neritina TaxID=10212 RepID=A0A7J7JAC0_BUGNE|nr:ABCB10 [Bugula neritina]